MIQFSTLVKYFSKRLEVHWIVDVKDTDLSLFLPAKGEEERKVMGMDIPQAESYRPLLQNKESKEDQDSSRTTSTPNYNTKSNAK
jgi:hypothetical protein